MAMHSTKIDVAKKVGDKREKVGEVEIFVPGLDEFGIEAEVKSVGEDGLPVYAKDEHNFLFAAIEAATKMQARNRLQAGKAEVKPGSKISTTLAELMAENERTGNAEYLKAITALKAKFGVWVGTTGKSAAAQATLITLFKNKEALALQSTANKQKFAGYVAQFAETLDADTLAAGQRYLESLLEVTNAETVEEDF